MTLGLLGDVFKIGSSIIGGSSSKKASKKAQAAQIAGLNNAVGSVNTGYEDIAGLLAPYILSGTGAQGGLNDLLGITNAGQTDWGAYATENPDVAAEYNSGRVDKAQFPTLEDYSQFHYQAYGRGEGRDISGITTGTGGANAQSAAIASLQNSPLYESRYRAGEEAILNNASATGGLRGGNIQSSLANFGRDTLSSVIQQQIANLSGVANNGLAATNTQAGAAGDKSAAIAKLLSQIGDTNAGGILQRGTINANTINQVSKGLGSMFGGGFNGTGFSQGSLDAGQIF